MYNSVAKCYAFGAIINVLFFARIIPYIVPGTDADPTALASPDQGHSVAQPGVKEFQTCADGGVSPNARSSGTIPGRFREVR